ncbi:MAG: lipid-A-disaccharide synthase [Gammaproteobacteria bacterium]|nr:lipid-A-disaccharide synthase [Gammaproteobacteria bacterium]
MIRIGIVAGETSGDAIAADLIHVIKKQYPDAVFEGIAGPKMKAAGCTPLYDSERLAVMAITEVLRRLPELLNIRKSIATHFINNPPDVFIGVDAPDFNLALEKKLKENGIPTVHYVSPSVWAWRQYRIKKIAKSIDLMLTLFPFEMEFYKKHNVPVKFVGHPMADQITFDDQKPDARFTLQCENNTSVIALLPGSRFSEVQRLLPLMIDTAAFCYEQNNKLEFLLPAATEKLQTYIENYLKEIGCQLPVRVIAGKARSVMQASDVILLASGTATLEAMLLNRPMVVTYKVSKTSYWIMKLLSNVNYVALPNFFGDTQPVPEFLQDNATKENLGGALLYLMEDKNARDSMCETFRHNHKLLKLNASQQAADAIFNLIRK